MASNAGPFTAITILVSRSNPGRAARTSERNTPWQKLSETSDVFFSISRAQYDGFLVRKLPPFVASRHGVIYGYMLAKYTLRCKFYQAVAILCRAPRYDLVREVVNPGKDHKLAEVASRHQIDPVKFKRIGRQLRRVWPLLP